MEIKKVKVWSFARNLMIIGLIIGLFFGILTSLYSLTIVKALETQISTAEFQQYLETNGANVESTLAYLWTMAKFGWIMSTIVSGIISLILGFAIAWIYNLSAKKFGGIVIEFNDKVEHKR